MWESEKEFIEERKKKRAYASKRHGYTVDCKRRKDQLRTQVISPQKFLGLEIHFIFSTLQVLDTFIIDRNVCDVIF